MAKRSVQTGDEPSNSLRGSNSVFLSVGVTLNMGEYETLRVDVGQWEPTKGNKTTARKRVEREVLAELKRVCSVAKKQFNQF